MSRIKKNETSLPSAVSKTAEKNYKLKPAQNYRLESAASDYTYEFNFIHTQKNAVFMLKKILQTGKIPNALLFTGNRDTGRKKAALFFAMAINCFGHDGGCHDGGCKTAPGKSQHSVNKDPNRDEILLAQSSYRDEPCCKCISCKKIISGMHPDIMTVSPEKDRIKISQIRKINANLTTKPNEAAMRMVLIEDAEKMNMEAGNALLKILEEPPDRTFFILISDNPANLLPTILSRCRQIKFIQISSRVIESELKNHFGIDPVTASIAARYSNGSIKRAMMFADIDKQAYSNQDKDKVKKSTPDWVKKRKWLIGEVSHMIIDKCENKRHASFALAMAEKISSEPDYIKDTLFVLKTWLRDLAVYRYSPDKIINHDFSLFLKDITKRVSVPQIISWFKELNAVEDRIKSNTSVRLALECFFLKLIF